MELVNPPQPVNYTSSSVSPALGSELLSLSARCRLGWRRIRLLPAGPDPEVGLAKCCGGSSLSRSTCRQTDGRTDGEATLGSFQQDEEVGGLHALPGAWRSAGQRFQLAAQTSSIQSVSEDTTDNGPGRDWGKKPRSEADFFTTSRSECGFAASRAALLLVETLMDRVWERRGRPAAAGPSALDKTWTSSCDQSVREPSRRAEPSDSPDSWTLIPARLKRLN